MPDETTNAEAKLKKLGGRVRTGLTQRHPVPENGQDIVRQTVREEWQREQETKRSQSPISPAKKRNRKPPEPER